MLLLQWQGETVDDAAEDLEKLGAEAFAFVNLARFAVPARLALALSTTPWIKENIVEKYIDPPKDC